MTSGVAGHHSPETTHTVGQHWAWHAIITLYYTHMGTMSRVACHTSPWISHTIRRRRVWHAIMSLDSTNGRMLHARVDIG